MDSENERLLARAVDSGAFARILRAMRPRSLPERWPAGFVCWPQRRRGPVAAQRSCPRVPGALAPFALATCAGMLAGGPDLALANGPVQRRVGEEAHMGVVVRIEAYFPPAVSAPKAFRSAFDRIAALEREFSSYRRDSELRRIEDQAWRRPVAVSREFALVLEEALRLARESKGAFDPTVGRVTRLLRQHGWGRESPSERALREAWRRTGWRHVHLDRARRTVRVTRRGLQLDLGGIAKGFIADEALAELGRAGVASALVAIAGDIAAGEPPPGQAGWRVGLGHSGPRGSVERHILLRNQAVSTSGGWERHFYRRDRRCSHIVTRQRGGCLDQYAAVSVVAPNGLLADGLATALAAIGPGRGAPLLSRRPGAVAYWPPLAPIAGR